jgi:hypothetical protein
MVVLHGGPQVHKIRLHWPLLNPQWQNHTTEVSQTLACG